MLELLPETLFQLAFVEELIGKYRWLWPLCEVIHFIGLTLLVGIITIFDIPSSIHRSTVSDGKAPLSTKSIGYINVLAIERM